VWSDDPAAERRDRGHEQHAPEAPLSHRRQRALCEEERCAEVDRQRLVEVGGGHLLQRPPASESGVADEHVDRAETRLDGVDQLAGSLRLPQIGADRDRLPASRADRCREFLGRLAVPSVAECHSRPSARDPQRDRLADAAAAARHERHAALEGVLDDHGHLLPRRRFRPQARYNSCQGVTTWRWTITSNTR
jgi:hypothetical protein